MAGRRRCTGWWLLGLGVACRFDASGIDDVDRGPGGTDAATTAAVGTTDGTGSGASPTTGEVVETSGSAGGSGTSEGATAHGSSGAAESTGAREGTGSTSESGGGSTGGTSGGAYGSSSGDLPPCDDLQEGLLFVRDASLDQMMIGQSDLLPEIEGEPVSYATASSPVRDGAGTVTFPFDLTCEAEIFFWGLVFDDVGNRAVSNADSFYFRVDGQPPEEPPVWDYGCARVEGWHWRALDRLVGERCSLELFSQRLAPGNHTLAITNREVDPVRLPAAIAAIAFSSDPDFDPSELYPVQED